MHKEPRSCFSNTKRGLFHFCRYSVIQQNNTQKGITIINRIFKNIYESGTTTVVVAGLRGSDSILSNSQIDDEDLRNWSLRVKIIPKDVRKCIEENKEKYPSLNIFERTGCAASFLVGNEKSYNSYWFSPQLAKCLSCPLKETCYDKQENFTVTDSSHGKYP